MILRNSNEKYKYLIKEGIENIDYIVVLVIEISKLIKNKNSDFNGSYFDSWKKYKQIGKKGNILNKILSNLETDYHNEEPSINSHNLEGNGNLFYRTNKNLIVLSNEIKHGKVIYKRQDKILISEIYFKF